jgi:hypothetical protein
MAYSVLLVTILVSGAAAGLRSGRWGSSQSVQAAVARLDRVPLSLGADWDVQETRLSDREVAVAEIEGYLARRYIHRRRGTVVSLNLLTGRPGPISVHTPAVCFTGAGYVAIGSAKVYTPPTGSRCRFLVRDFQKSNVAAPTLLRVFQTWGQEGAWSVPDNPRIAFAGKPYLYKLYVVRQMTQKNEPIEEDPSVELIEGLMPQLQSALFSGT